MMDPIDQLFKIKAQTSQIEGVMPCAAIIGSNSSVQNFAAFWRNNSMPMGVLAAKKLLDFVRDQDFTKEELATFKLGLAMFPEFMKECCQEEAAVKMMEQQKERENKSH